VTQYLGLDHVVAVESHLIHGVVDVHPVVLLYVLQQAVQHDEGPRPTNTSTETPRHKTQLRTNTEYNTAWNTGMEHSMFKTDINKSSDTHVEVAQENN